jgi:hypothetical protein
MSSQQNGVEMKLLSCFGYEQVDQKYFWVKENEDGTLGTIMVATNEMNVPEYLERFRVFESEDHFDFIGHRHLQFVDKLVWVSATDPDVLQWYVAREVLSWFHGDSLKGEDNPMPIVEGFEFKLYNSYHGEGRDWFADNVSYVDNSASFERLSPTVI